MKLTLTGVKSALKYDHEQEMAKQQNSMNQMILNAMKQNFSVLLDEFKEKRTQASAQTVNILRHSFSNTTKEGIGILEVDAANSSLEAQCLAISNENEELKTQLRKLREGQDLQASELASEMSSLTQELVPFFRV